jgi:hypothetical protein
VQYFPGVSERARTRSSRVRTCPERARARTACVRHCVALMREITPSRARPSLGDDDANDAVT